MAEMLVFSALQKSSYITELSREKLMVAEQARRATIEILEDALENRFYGFPVSFGYSCSKPVDSYQFCCIPTETLLRDLLQMMKEVSFREDSDPEESETFAYVRPEDRNNLVYLCKEFWSAPDYLCQDSKPGTLIHEVSHLLGTEDITYELLTVDIFELYGTLLGSSRCIIDEDGKGHWREEVAQVNANCLEHEFETIINHEKSYQDGRYTCCEETKMNSVCRFRSTAHYHLYQHFESKRKDMEEKLQEYQRPVQRPDIHKGTVKYAKIRNSACRKSYTQNPKIFDK